MHARECLCGSECQLEFVVCVLDISVYKSVLNKETPERNARCFFSWIKLKLEIDDSLCDRTALELFGSDKRNANFGAF